MLSAALILAACSMVISPAQATNAARPSGVDDFAFESFDAQYFLSRTSDGLATMRVVETIVALFPGIDQNRGILRDIPRYYGDNPLNPTVLSVTDDDERAVPYTTSTVSAGDGPQYSFTELALGTDDYVHGRTTYVITYELENVIGRFSDANIDELYWDINGTGWSQTFGRVSTSIHIDPSLDSALTGDVACFYGYSGSGSTCSLLADSAGTTYSTSVESINPYSTVTVVIDFRDGTFVQPKLAKDSWIITIAPWALVLVSLLLILVAIFVRVAIWRDARGRGIVVPQYSAPPELDLLLAGDLVHHENSAMAAQFVGLAVAGLVNVVDLKNRFALEFVKTDGATVQEARVLDALFGSSPSAGHKANLESLAPARGAALYAMRAKARQRAISAGLRALPGGHFDRYLRRFTWLILLAYVAIFVWTIFTEVDASPVFGFGVLSAIACMTASIIISKPYLLTAAGADQRDYLLGIRDYLSLAEEARLRVLQSPEGAERVDITDKRAVVKLNEKLLSFAVLWGVEREWSKQLAVQYASISENPTWLSGNIGATDFGSVVSSFSNSSTSSIRPMVTSSGGGSSWSSSGSSSFSSGSSGGGFSGGGGGGGGGGGR
jgi:uncharacterized membrane protein YgcG